MIIGLFIHIYVSVIMIGIGISQYKSKQPVGFYTRETSLKEEQLSDVSAWNKKHGTMWIIYGIIIIFSFLIEYLLGESIYSIILMCGGILIPLPVMIWYHHRLLKIYKKED